MKEEKGILLISCGESDGYVDRCIRSILASTSLPFHVHRAPAAGLETRKVKLMMDLVSPFDETLYMDTDTLLLQDPLPLFQLFSTPGSLPMYMALGGGSRSLSLMLRHGFYDKHVRGKQRTELERMKGTLPHLNSGVILFKKRMPVVNSFFARWRETLAKHGGLDEPAMFPAMEIMRPGMLSSRWNFQYNIQKPEDLLIKRTPRTGILHLCGERKPENYERVSRLLGGSRSFLRW